MMNILIVEDNVTDYAFLHKALDRALEEDLSVHHEQAIEDAVDWLHDHKDHTDMIFLDLGLPDAESRCDAFEKVLPFVPYIPVIIMTGDDDEKLAYELLSLGAEDFVVKGGDRRRQDLLRETVYHAMSRHKAVKRLNDRITADEQSIHWLSGGYSMEKPS